MYFILRLITSPCRCETEYLIENFSCKKELRIELKTPSAVNSDLVPFSMPNYKLMRRLNTGIFYLISCLGYAMVCYGGAGNVSYRNAYILSRVQVNYINKYHSRCKH